MTRDKKIFRFAKSLVRLSLEDGRVSEQRVEAVLSHLRAAPPRRVVDILEVYRHLLRREIDRCTARVAAASEITPSLLQSVEQALSARYDRPVAAVAETDPGLIAGIRIRVGDDVIDASVAGKLDRLAAQVR